jgi:hypothetical protein
MIIVAKTEWNSINKDKITLQTRLKVINFEYVHFGRVRFWIIVFLID